MVEKGPDVEMCVDISTPRSAVKSTQTDFTLFYTANSDDHSYSVSFTKTLSSDEQSKAMQELLEEKEIMLNKLKEQLGQMKKKLDQYKEQEFTLEKIKDDDSAIQFYTGFPNYKSLLAFHEYLEPKIAKLQYWGAKNIVDSQPYQEEGKKKPGWKRKLTSLDELFIVLIRLKVGLFVRDLADRFGLSPSHLSKIFVSWINFLYF